MPVRPVLPYGVSQDEVSCFVEDNDCVREFLGKFRTSTRDRYAAELCRFFKWLRVEKGLELSPKELLNLHLKRRGSTDIEERRWALRLVLDFSRDNLELNRKDASDSRKRFMFIVVKTFFNYHDVPLTTMRGVFGGRKKRKYKPKQMNVATAKKVMAVLNQRDRAVCMVMLQSGMSIGDVLNKFNFMLDYVRSEIMSGSSRVRLDFEERKGNGFNYFTFISKDAIQELKKWFAERELWLKGREDPGAIFVTQEGGALTVLAFEMLYDYHLRRAELKKGPYSLRCHMFRKLFKTEASVPDRNIDDRCVEFWMGHIGGIENNPLRSMGGVYDSSPELYDEVIEEEYAKLEPYVNIYSGETAGGLEEREAEIEALKAKLDKIEARFDEMQRALWRRSLQEK